MPFYSDIVAHTFVMNFHMNDFCHRGLDSGLENHFFKKYFLLLIDLYIFIEIFSFHNL